MSNLGKYQDILAAAKAAGGVENLIGTIEDGAVGRAAPGLTAKGVGIGVVGTLGAVGAVVAGRRYRERRKERLANAKDAKDQLRTAIEGTGAAERADIEDDGQLPGVGGVL